MENSRLRVLVVDDYEPWRRHVCSALREQLKLDVVAEAADGLEGVQRAQELQPDLILLDIGLPKLNGIEVARRVLQLLPKSTILFASENRSSDVAEEALSTGALGFIVKSDAASELLPAVEAALKGKRFVSACFAGMAFARDKGQNVEIRHNHEVGFYLNDLELLNDATQFVTNALKAGNAAIVIATESHRYSLLPRFLSQGLDIDAATEQGRYIALDAAETLSIFMHDDLPDAARFIKAFGDLVLRAANNASGVSRRVAVFGECVHLLWAQGNAEAAIQMEKLGNQLAHLYEVDILCGYCVGSVQGGMDANIYEQVCAEHSAVHSW